jgi:hypothetical protein
MWQCSICSTENPDNRDKCLFCGTHRNLTKTPVYPKPPPIKKKKPINTGLPSSETFKDFFDKKIKPYIIILFNSIYFRDIIFGAAFYLIIFLILNRYVPDPQVQARQYQYLMRGTHVGVFYKFKLNFFMITFFMLPLFLHISLTNRDFINNHLLKYETKKGIMVLLGFFFIPLIGGLLGLLDIEISIYNSMQYLSYVWCLSVIIIFLVKKFKYYLNLKNFQLFFFTFMFIAYIINPMFLSSLTFSVSNKLCEAAVPKDSIYHQTTEIKVNAELANIRDGPSMDHKVIARVKYGTILEVLGKEQNWFHVSIPSQKNQKGYIHKNIVVNYR